jgi:tripartite-type tricarboxylate transporter receptor subunit TctC
MKPITLILGVIVFAATLAIAPRDTLAQEYPSKPIKLIVPAVPGSVPDIRARQISAKLAEVLGQPIVIDNRPGGSSIIAAAAAAHATPGVRADLFLIMTKMRL